jgi:hypothetical protein
MRQRRDGTSARDDVPYVEWADFLDQFVWNQGEHVTAVGPTGTGKTFLILALIEWRAALTDKWHAVILATKPKDKELSRLDPRRWVVLGRERWFRRDWPPPALARLVIVWPKWKRAADFKKQRAAFLRVFDGAFSDGHWAIYVDELEYFCRRLRMQDELQDCWKQGRSLRVTLIGSFQRPAWVPLDAYSAATHLFFWRTNDETDLRRIGGVGGMSSTLIREVVSTLDHQSHEVLYLNTRTGAMLRTHVRKPR